MVVFDLYSKRRKRELGQVADVFVYDNIPTSLRIQVAHIWKDALGDPYREYNRATKQVFESLHDVLAREYGTFQLGSESDERKSLLNFFIKKADSIQALDIIELSFRFIEAYGNNWEFKRSAFPDTTPERAIEELNARFLEHSLGYEFVSHQLVRKDSEIAHKEVVIPALQLLHEEQFEGANEEYLSAHEHYRHGNIEECLTDCLKAFESTLKTVCKRRSWAYSETDTAKTLIDVVFRNELIPSFLQSQLTALRSALESGVPTVRNKMGGHGQGEAVREVPPYFASYLLNLTAANILLIVNAYKYTSSSG